MVGCASGEKQTRTSPYLTYPTGYSQGAARQFAGLRISGVPNDKAVVVLFRDDQQAWNLSAAILDNGEPVSILMAYTHVVYTTNPGRHRFAGMCTGNPASVMEGDLSPGKVYFIGFRTEGTWLLAFRFQAIAPGTPEWSRLPAFFAESVQVEPNGASPGWFASRRSELTRRADEVATDRGKNAPTTIPVDAGVSLDSVTWMKR